jgi:hypothetical protein
VIKSLGLILLLDYSGSMEQVLDQEAKYKTLQTQTTALISSFKKNEKVQTIVFGSAPKLGCQDIKIESGIISAQVEYLKSLKPGPFGMTPLSKALKIMSKEAIKNKVKTVIALTDGGDSCGQDPCQALADISLSLQKEKTTLNLVFIGFDLKKEKSKLVCLKEKSFKNLNITYLESSDAESLQDLLKQVQYEALLAEGAESARGEVSGVQSLKSTKGMNSSSQNSSPQIRGEGLSQVFANVGLLEVVGAPSTAVFNLTGVEQRNWLGPFVVKLIPGKYRLKFQDAMGLEIEIEIKRGQHLKLPWANLISKPIVTLRLQDVVLTTEWTPDEKTKLIHGTSQEFHFRSLDGQPTYPLPFGKYKIKTSSPSWLADLEKSIYFGPGEDVELSIEAMFKDHIKLVDNPFPGVFSVLEIQEAGGRTERHLVTGQKRVPIKKEQEYKFLDK